MKKEDLLIEIAAQILEIEASQVILLKNREDYDQWDSLAHVQLAAEISDRFNVSIPFEHLPEIKCLRDFIKYMGV